MDKESLFTQILKAPVRLFTGSKTTYTAPVEPKTYTVRGVTFTDKDLEEAKRIIFSEISNRPADKQELEARVLMNTAINRAVEYSKKGKNVSLTEVFQQPNQYQGYNSPQYKLYSDQSANVLDAAKKSSISTITSKLQKEIESGQFQDNTNGAFYYQHKGDKIYYDDRKPLFRPMKPQEPLFTQNQ